MVHSLEWATYQCLGAIRWLLKTGVHLEADERRGVRLCVRKSILGVVWRRHQRRKGVVSVPFLVALTNT